MILVDTSAWVDFFKGRSRVAAAVDRLLEDNQVALCGPILTELGRGFQNESERKKTMLLFESCHLLPEPPELWKEAGHLGFSLRRKGSTLKTLDLLIGTYALYHRVPILSLDQDFRRMMKLGVPLTMVD
jgi:predicted nucleic acid-binding protein